MLLELRLKGLGVIAEAVLDLGPGLTVVTGETGAGKTMVVTGLGLLLGGRADSGAVRAGAGQALVEGCVRVDPGGPAARRAVEAGAELDEGDVLIISRTVSAEGRGRAYLGGRSVPVAVLSELADDLVAVHGQSDQIRLRFPLRQRQALDRFSGAALAAILGGYRPRWQRLREVQGELDELTVRARERAAEAELLRLGLAEVERVDPQPGEDERLRAQAQRLGHVEELQAAAAQALGALAGQDEATGWGSGADAVDLLNQARQVLETVRGHDARLAVLADRLVEISVLAADVAAECAGYTQDLDADPARLAAVEERRAEIAGLTRSYGENVAEVLEWARNAGLRLLDLEGDDERRSALLGERDRLVTELGELAGEVSQERRAAAVRLADAVSRELAELAMPHARLEVVVSQREAGDGGSEGTVLPVRCEGSEEARTLAAGPDGVDEVELLLSPHPGAAARPLARGASGGELSRVMLGLEVVLGAADPVPTFVFDEVDAGVGGRSALGIGRRLARLARTAQVIVVTHLPQVAAYADRHLVVTKSSAGEVTESGVRLLDAPGRVTELARMLGGMAESGSAQAHAEELLATARAEREDEPSAALPRRRRGTIVG